MQTLAAGVLGAGLVLWLLSSWWFWALCGALGGVAALFAMLAAIIHYEIGMAMLMLGAWLACWVVAGIACRTEGAHAFITGRRA